MFNQLNDLDARFICEEGFFQDLSLIRLGANPIEEDGWGMLTDHFGDRVTIECERDDDYLYTIDDDNRFDTGFGDHLTQLLVWSDKVAVFDHAGNVLETLYRDVPEEEGITREQRWANHAAASREWQKQLGFQPHPIQVKRVRFKDGSGIRGFNWWHEAFENPGHPQFEDVRDAVQSWIHDGQFEYNYGGDNVWLDRTGEVTDT